MVNTDFNLVNEPIRPKDYSKHLSPEVKNLHTNVSRFLYSDMLSNMEKREFADALRDLERTLLGPSRSYNREGLDHLRNYVWGPLYGRRAIDQFREMQVFELASLLIINREVRNRWFIDRRLDAVINILEQRQRTGFLCGNFGNLRLATIKLYRATYENRFKAYDTITPESVAIGRAEGLSLARKITPITPQEKHLVADFYFRLADSYRLLASNSLDLGNQERLLRDVNKYSRSGSRIFSEHEGLNRLRKQTELAFGYLQDERSGLLDRIYSRLGGDFRIGYNRKTTISDTKYTYDVNTLAGVQTSPFNSLVNTKTVNEIALGGSLEYPFSPYLSARAGLDLVWSDINNRLSADKYSWDDPTYTFNRIDTPDITDNYGFNTIPRISYDLGLRYSPILRQESLLFISELYLNPYYRHISERQFLSPEYKNLPRLDYSANVLGLGLGFSMAPSRMTRDLFNFWGNMDISLIKDKVRTARTDTGVLGTFNQSNQQYDLNDQDSAYNLDRLLYNFSGRTGFDIIGSSFLGGINYQYNLRPEYLYDYTRTEDSYIQEHLFGLRLGYQNRFRWDEDVYEYGLIADAQIDRNVGDTHLPRSLSLEFRLREQLSRVEYFWRVGHSWAAPVHSSNGSSSTVSDYNEWRFELGVKCRIRPGRILVLD